MKNYRIKNYRGNLVESLTKFAKSHKGMRIVEAVEAEDELKVKAEVEESLNDKRNQNLVKKIEKWIDKQNYTKTELKDLQNSQSSVDDFFEMARELGFTDNPYDWDVDNETRDFIGKTFDDSIAIRLKNAGSLHKKDEIDSLVKWIDNFMDKQGWHLLGDRGQKKLANALRDSGRFQVTIISKK